MGSTEDATVLAVIAATPELATSDDTDGFLDAMPIPEFASTRWSETSDGEKLLRPADDLHKHTAIRA
jgi:hypothetical protein